MPDSDIMYEAPGDRKCDPSDNNDGCDDDDGNGCKCEPKEECSEAPIHYPTGTIYLTEVDTSANVPGFAHARVWRNSIVANNTYNGPNGYNWDIAEWAYLVKRTLTVTGQPDKITMNVRMGSTQMRFDKVGSDYVVRHSKLGRVTFTHDSTNNIFVLTRRMGRGVETLQFHDFDQSTSPKGLLKKRIDTDGYETTVTYTAGSDGPLENIKTMTMQREGDYSYQLVYDYHLSGTHLNKINHVTLNELDDTGSSTVTTPIRRTRYLYYDGMTKTDYGAENDLEAAITQKPDGSGGWDDIEVCYYRYYVTNGQPSVDNGYAHALKYVVGPTAYQDLIQHGQDPLAGVPTGDDLVPDYADHYFEYDSQRRVKKEVARDCSSCGSSGGTSNSGDTFVITRNPRYNTQTTSDYKYNTWKTKTVSNKHDGHQVILYANRVDKAILKVVREVTNDGEVPREWCTYFEYDNQGREILRAEPSAVSGYSEALSDLVGKHASGGTYTFLKSHEGLVHLTTWPSSTTATSSTAGDAIGYQQSTSIKEGVLGTEIKTHSYKYFESDNGAGGGVPTYVVADSVTYPDETNQDATKITTSYSYQWYAPTGDKGVRLKERVTTLPSAPTMAQPNTTVTDTTASEKEYFDAQGNLIWTMDPRGIIDGMAYEPKRNQLETVIRDYCTASGWPSLPSGWSVTGGSHFEYLTDYEYDNLGRQTQMLGPAHDTDTGGMTAENVRTATFMLHIDSKTADQSLNNAPLGDQVRSAQGYATGSAGSYTFTVIDPITISMQDKRGRPLNQVVSIRSTSGGSDPLNEGDTFLRADWVRWSAMTYTAKGQLATQRNYYDIPAFTGLPADDGLQSVYTDEGDSTNNCNETFFGYSDDSNLRVRTYAPDGTITRTVYDNIDRPIAVYVGTDDIPDGETCWRKWTPDAPGTNLLQVSATQYDDGLGGGMSNVTTQTAYVDSSGANDRVTTYLYDFRNRQTAVDGEETFYQIYTYDNLNRQTRFDSHDTTGTGLLIGRSEMVYDDRSRVESTKLYAVDPTTGAVGNALTGQTYYDAANNVVEAIAPGAGIIRSYNVFDNLGRSTLSSTGYPDASASSGSVTIEGLVTFYDEASNITSTYSSQLNAGSTETSPNTRISFQYSWYDGINRPVGVADYGAPLGPPPSRPSVVPTRSDTILVTTTQYNDRGEAFSMTDPGGIETRTTYDDLGRATQTIENYVASPSTPDQNRTTETTYTPDSQVKTLTAIVATGNQVTTYHYGTTTAAPESSDVITNNLLHEIVYPDGSQGTDSVRLSYNRQGQVTKRIDQAGTTHEYIFDKLGRPRHDCVTAFGTGINMLIRRLTTEYEVRGMPSLLSSCIDSMPNDTPSGGGVYNQVKLEYNTFGQLTSDWQSHSGRVHTGTAPSLRVQYAYADGSSNSNQIRPTSITYPDGRQIDYTYDTAGSINDSLNRIHALKENTGGSTIAQYDYLGLAGIVRSELPEPSLRFDVWGGTVGTYTGLDSFNRITNDAWYDDNSTPTKVVDLEYGYTCNSLPKYCANNLVASSDDFDVLYGRDGLDRLNDYTRGGLNSSQDSIPTADATYRQLWGLDEVGNWSDFDQDNNGDGSSNWTYETTRTHNSTNEISTIGDTKPDHPWVDPAYDAAGNTIRGTAIEDIEDTPIMTYDAWNRLVRVTDSQQQQGTSPNTLADYQYDARHFRVSRGGYTTRSNTSRTHYYYSSSWQCIEERHQVAQTGWTSNNIKLLPAELSAQYVWGLRYVDDLIQRKRDTTDNGSLDETLYSLNDKNFDVVAIADTSGTILQRYVTTPYGQTRAYSASYGSPTGNYDWEFIFQGLRRDLSNEFIYNRHRDLDPLLGRFLQRDPLGYVDGANLYSAYHVMWNGVDPRGMNNSTQNAVRGGNRNTGPKALAHVGEGECCYSKAELWYIMGYKNKSACVDDFVAKYSTGFLGATASGAALVSPWLAEKLGKGATASKAAAVIAAYFTGREIGIRPGAIIACSLKYCNQAGVWETVKVKQGGQGNRNRLCEKTVCRKK